VANLHITSNSIRALALPAGVFPDLQVQKVVKSDISNVNSNHLQQNFLTCSCSNLTDITLREVDHNYLQKALSNFSSLKRLSLWCSLNTDNNNQNEPPQPVNSSLITELIVYRCPNSLVVDCPQLTHLELHGVNNKSIDDNWVFNFIPKFKALKNLCLRNTAIIQPIFKSKSLQVLKLKYNSALQFVTILTATHDKQIQKVHIIGDNPNCLFKILDLGDDHRVEESKIEIIPSTENRDFTRSVPICTPVNSLLSTAFIQTHSIPENNL